MLKKETVAEEVTEDFMRFIKASSQDDSEILRREIEKYQRKEPSIKFKYLMKYFMELESNLVLEWGSVNLAKGGIIKLPFHKIVQAFDIIRKFELGEQNKFEVRGRLIVGGIGEKKDKRIFVLSDEKNKKDYRGHISQELINSLDDNLELNEIYQAVMEEKLTVNSTTGEEIISYTLIGLTKINTR
ncbi:MAG: hypothetical protein HC820_05125 [Hydrococcus sp. RM1_1_31]|nr:hypothetical protein [Hydrococcus sp. RM1_1_31]